MSDSARQPASASSSPDLAAARQGDAQAFGRLAEPHRRELLVHSYRMLGSLAEAEDVVQETMLRAWRRLHTFEGRAPFRAWLYKIATNAGLDLLDRRRARRILPPQASPPSDPAGPILPPAADAAWLEPLPEETFAQVLASQRDQNPEARYDARESVTLAFLTALQLLPARQRVVLLMRDVLDWRASDVAELLEMSVPAVNSALHRARKTLAQHYDAPHARELRPPADDPATQDLLDRYVHAWEAADVQALLALFREEATAAMPPSPSWYAGREAIRGLAEHVIFAGADPARWRLLPVAANAQPAFGMYERAAVGQAYLARGLMVLTLARGGVDGMITFFDPAVFLRFGLPGELPPA